MKAKRKITGVEIQIDSPKVDKTQNGYSTKGGFTKDSCLRVRQCTK